MFACFQPLGRFCLLWISALAVGTGWVWPLAAQSPVLPATNQTAAAEERDLAAAQFLTRCAGCHSLEGRKLNGPELSHVGAWADDQLRLAIRRMEKNVGPMQEPEVTQLADLLRNSRVRERLRAEEARMAALFAAKMEPPNAAVGRLLFSGKQPLQNGGLACVACHVADGDGGNLGPALNGSFAKMGEMPLISAIEKAGFKIMEPHYRRHPINRQEAMHLARYLATLNPNQALPAGAPIGTLGAGSALAFAIGLVFYQRSQRKGRRRDIRLQRRRN